MTNGFQPAKGFLLVPVGVEALLVGKDAKTTTSWVDLTPRFETAYENWGLFERDLVSLFKDQDDSGPHRWVPQPGIHLHWALPRALTHASQHASDQSGYPRIPNRWLVQRLFWRDVSESATLVSWIIESDAVCEASSEPAERPAVTIPDMQAQKLYSRLGRYRQLPDGDWSDDNIRGRLPLTALGWGHPAFTAYYPASKSVLGFHDPNPPVVGADDHLAYQVVGWYDDPTQDPLHDADDPGQWQAKLAELRWWCGADLPPSPPTRTICHGSVVGIHWRQENGADPPGPIDRHRVESKVPTGEYDIAVGSSTVEALAQRLAGGDLRHEMLLEALQYGVLGSNPDRTRLAEQLHLRRYMPRPGGISFELRDRRPPERRPRGEHPEVRPLRNGNAPAGLPGVQPGALETERSSAPAEIPDDFQNALVQLNDAADCSERARHALAVARQRLYAEWCLWARTYLSNEEAPDEDDFNTDFGALAADPLDDMKRALTSTLQELTQMKADLEQDLALRYPTLELVESTRGPFFEANDPAVLINGPGLTPPARIARPTGDAGRYCVECDRFYGDGELRAGDRCPLHDRQVEQRRRCRLSTNLVEAMTVLIPNTDLRTDIWFGDLFTIEPANPAHSLTIGAIAEGLLLEFLGLDPASADRIARQAYDQAGFKENMPHLDRLVTRIEQLQERPYRPRAESPVLRGTAPAPPWRTAWASNPWLPLLLQWEVEWNSEAQSAGSAWAPGDNWQLSEQQEDFQPVSDVLAVETTQTFSGWTMLNPDPAWLLKWRLAELAVYHPEAGLEAILAELSATEAVSQSLGGFGDKLLQRESGLWLQPVNPAYLIGEVDEPIDPIDRYLYPVEGERGVSALMPLNPALDFLPIRAGALTVKRLWIVDAFGQTLQLNAFGEATQALESDRARLAPRLTQPARLRFDWVQSAASPAAGPVHGWIVPNHLDKSFLVYDDHGENLGAIQRRIGSTTDRAFFWVPAPGDDSALVGGRPHPPETNAVLTAFIDYLLRLGPDAGKAFYTAVDKLLGEKHAGRPEDDPLLSILVGRPLALAQASLGLELEGPPARGWTESGSAEPANWTEVAFPLRLGDARDGGDGLVGWLEDGAFCFAWGQTGKAHDELQFNQELTVDAVQPRILTLLFDPHREVAARTGILPVRRVALPPRAVTASAAIKGAFFLAAPLLGASDAPRMPAPSDDFGQWSWAVRPEVTFWRAHDEISAADSVATFQTAPQRLTEGWLTLRINPVVILSFWLKQRPTPLPPGAEITLTWKLQGAELLALAIDGEPRMLAAWTTLDNPPAEWAAAIAQTTDPTWRGSEPPTELKLVVHATTTYVLTAADQHGNTRRKTLTVEVTPAT